MAKKEGGAKKKSQIRIKSFSRERLSFTVTSLRLKKLKEMLHKYSELDVSEANVSNEEVVHMINALCSTEVTPAEQALGHFTQRKHKQLENWDQWLAGERKQLDQFFNLEMYGEPCKLPPNGILLRQHWQYQVRRNGER